MTREEKSSKSSPLSLQTSSRGELLHPPPPSELSVTVKKRHELNKKYSERTYFDQKRLKIAKMRKKHGHLGLETPLGSRIAVFLNVL